MSEKQNNKALFFIFITVLVDSIGLGIIIPVLPGLIQKMMHCSVSEANYYGNAMLTVYALMQFVFAPIIGALSDRYGRRPVLLLSLFGFGVDYLLLAFAPSIGWFFLGRIIAGFTGASFTTASAYIADVSPPEKRSQNYGIIGAGFGMGFIIGPAIGGFISELGDRIPFFVAAGLALLNWFYGFFILPESLKPENRRRFEWKRANPIGSLVHLKRYPALVGIALMFFLQSLAGQSLPSTWAYFSIERFNWSEGTIGASLAVVGISIALVQAVLNRILIPKIGEKRSIYAGLMFSILGFVFCAASFQSWMLFAACIPLALGGLAGPTIQGVASKQVPANEQGELQGFLTSLMSLTSILGPMLFGFLFGFFTGHSAPAYVPGAPFYAAALLTLGTLFVGFVVLKRYLGAKAE
ncbi:MAG: MFS transporter, DHA1 family, tetracycline resistance protein [Bacteroidetes bacterium]|nr:MAG: MFS transporter, DHA1 family, tetracycline resistance protein [Bacteroidota bacterium]